MSARCIHGRSRESRRANPCPTGDPSCSTDLGDTRSLLGQGPTHLLVGDLPIVPGDDGSVRVLVTVWPDGTADIAARRDDRWGIPCQLVEAP